MARTRAVKVMKTDEAPKQDAQLTAAQAEEDARLSAEAVARQGPARETGAPREARERVTGQDNNEDINDDPHRVEHQHFSSERSELALHDIPRERVDMFRASGLLDAPPARPGMEQRWVRVQLALGQKDPRNIASAIRGGWRPRLAETAAASDLPSTFRYEGFDYIGVEPDLLLMERAIEIGDQERKLEADRIVERTRATLVQLEEVTQGRASRIVAGQRTDVSRGARPAIRSSAPVSDLVDDDIRDGFLLDDDMGADA